MAVLAAALLAAAVPANAQTTTQQQAPQQQAPEGQAPAIQAPAGQGPATPAAQHGDWVQRCTPNPPPEASPPKQGEEQVCFLTQQLVDQNNQRPVLKITIGFFQPGRRPGAVIAMPLGVPLADGIQIGVDGKGVAGVPFQVCRRDGCQAFLPLSEEVLGAFKAGAEGVVQLRAGESDPINLPFSLSGFTAGYGSIQ